MGFLAFLHHEVLPKFYLSSTYVANQLPAPQATLAPAKGDLLRWQSDLGLCLKIGEWWSKIKLWQIILASLTAAGFVGTIVESSKLLAIIGAVISTILLVLNAVVQDYDLGAVAQQQKQTANDIWLIREKYASLLSDLAIGQKTIEDGMRERDALSLELHSVYQGAPSTTYQAYKKAQQALEFKEDMTFSDEEIECISSARTSTNHLILGLPLSWPERSTVVITR